MTADQAAELIEVAKGGVTVLVGIFMVLLVLTIAIMAKKD